MNRSDHLNTAQLLADRADNLRQIGENVLAGEALWGAIIHGVSAADPEHEIQPPDRYGNPHLAPNTKNALEAAAVRMQSPRFTALDASRCLYHGQRHLHNHFYHLNLPPSALRLSLSISRRYARRLLRIAATSIPQSNSNP